MFWFFIHAVQTNPFARWQFWLTCDMWIAEVPCLFQFVLVGEIQREFVGVFNKTIIPLAVVGYEMIIANSALRASLAIYHLISNAPSWNNCQIVWDSEPIRLLKSPRSLSVYILIIFILWRVDYTTGGKRFGWANVISYWVRSWPSLPTADTFLVVASRDTHIDALWCKSISFDSFEMQCSSLRLNNCFRLFNILHLDPNNWAVNVTVFHDVLSRDNYRLPRF